MAVLFQSKHQKARKSIFYSFSGYQILLDKARTTTLHLYHVDFLAIDTLRIVYGKSPPFLCNFTSEKESFCKFRHINPLNFPRYRSTRFVSNPVL